MRAALFAASMSALAAATMTWNVSESGAQHRAHQAFGAAPGSAPDWSLWSWGSWCVRGEPVRFGDALFFALIVCVERAASTSTSTSASA